MKSHYTISIVHKIVLLAKARTATPIIYIIYYIYYYIIYYLFTPFIYIIYYIYYYIIFYY